MKDNRLHILSFVGGLVFLSVLTGILLSRNSTIRAEVENQARGFLNTGRDILFQLQIIVAKVAQITGEIRDIDEDEVPEVEPRALLSDGYDALWSVAEAQNEAYVKSHPS
jgi:hypothetical protein